MKTLLFLTSVLLASTSTSTCEPRTSQAKSARECAVSAAPAGAVKPAGVASAVEVSAPQEAKVKRPVLPAHLFM